RFSSVAPPSGGAKIVRRSPDATSSAKSCRSRSPLGAHRYVSVSPPGRMEIADGTFVPGSGYLAISSRVIADVFDATVRDTGASLGTVALGTWSSMTRPALGCVQAAQTKAAATA